MSATVPHRIPYRLTLVGATLLNGVALRAARLEQVGTLLSVALLESHCDCVVSWKDSTYGPSTFVRCGLPRPAFSAFRPVM